MAKQSITPKKIKKILQHGGHHGGSWKVAYADFVTAMMAFFLLMWLVTAKNMEQKVGVATYFEEYNVIEGKEGVKKKIDQKMKEYKIFVEGQRKIGVTLPEKPVIVKDTETAKIVSEWKNQIEQKLANVSDQVLVEAMSDGAVMIQLVDNQGIPMFPTGSSNLTLTAHDIMGVLWDKIKNENVKIAIEGHTDAYQYSASGKTNWELSTERASAARKELERLGLPPNKLIRVAGLADTQPISNDPYSPLNRRISILLYYFTTPTVPLPSPQPNTDNK